MSLLTFLIVYVLLIFISGTFISMFYHLSRHWIEVQEDGKEKITGDFLFWWSVIWEHETGISSRVYMYEALEFKHKELNRILPAIGSKLVVSDLFKSFLLLLPEQSLDEKELEKIEKVLKVRIIKTPNREGYYLSSNQPTYLFPKWIRKPLSACPKCMASVFGSIFYFGFVWQVKSAFFWAEHINAAIILLYVTFVVVLSAINSVLSKTLTKYV